VAIRETGLIVGHVPRAVSAVCSWCGGSIFCRITGSRRYSTDLPQNGLEVLCMLTFGMSNAKDIEKMKRIIDQESVSFSTLIKIGVIEKAVVAKLDSCAGFYDNSEKCNTKDCTNNCASLVSDNVDYHEPSVKRP